MAKQILCSICLAHGDVIACQIVNNEHFKCPQCGACVWPDEDDPDMVLRWLKQQQPNNYRSCSLPEGVEVHGGSSSNASNSRKEKMKKKSLTRINAGLSAKFESR